MNYLICAEKHSNVAASDLLISLSVRLVKPGLGVTEGGNAKMKDAKTICNKL